MAGTCRGFPWAASMTSAVNRVAQQGHQRSRQGHGIFQMAAAGGGIGLQHLDAFGPEDVHGFGQQLQVLQQGVGDEGQEGVELEVAAGGGRLAMALSPAMTLMATWVTISGSPGSPFRA